MAKHGYAGGLQLWRDEERAGKAVTNIVMTDPAAGKERLSTEGILPKTEACGSFGAVAGFFDEANNRIVPAEPPKS